MATLTLEQPGVTKTQYGRVKGASWFPVLYKKDVLLLGQGGIGSWVALLLARIGMNLYTFDMDNFESINLSGQMVRDKDVRKNKAIAIKEIIKEFAPDCEVETNGQYSVNSISNDIVICGFDCMVARRIAFDNWVKHLTPENRDKSFFQDGRLTAEIFQIFNITGNRQDLIDLYYKDYLFGAGEAPEAPCTFKQTSHTAAMIAGHMVAFLTNWAFNQTKDGKSVRNIPFYFEYVTPLNMMTSNDRL